MGALLTKQQFVERAQKRHGNKFDYSLVDYQSAKEVVTIQCSQHGKFQQTPDKHLQSKYGCMACWNEMRSEIGRTRRKPLQDGSRNISQEQYLERLKVRLRSDFIVDMSKYEGLTLGKVTVSCPEHGPSTHLPRYFLYLANGCAECGKPNRHPRVKSFDDFMQKLQAVHGSKYEAPYPEEYENRKSMMTLVCESHGVFSKRAQKALSGQGCGLCRHEELIANGTLSGGYNERLFAEKPELASSPATIYYLRVGPVWKVGITRNKLNRRLDHIRSASKLPVELLDSHECILEEAFRLEQAILQDFHLVRTYEMWSSEVFSQDVLNGVPLADYANAIEL